MKGKLYIVGLALVLSAVVITGCGPVLAQPTEVTGVDVEIPTGVQGAFDAVLAYLAANYGGQAPATDLAWAEENVTPGWPEKPVPGWVEYQFTAGDWVVTVGNAALPPERTTYRVSAANRAAGFQWDGVVDAGGQVVERLAADEVLAARDAALAYIFQKHGLQIEPEPGLVWVEKNVTAEGLVGGMTFEFSTGDWVVTVSYPVVSPDAVIYRVSVVNSASDLRWDGELDAAGNVKNVFTPLEPVVGAPDPARARDAALAYAAQNHGIQPPPPEGWIEEEITPGGLVGSVAYRYTGGDWVITVSFPVVAPENVVYQVVVTNEGTGLHWEGEVDAAFRVTELSVAGVKLPALCWYGRVESAPAESAYDDYLVLLPEEQRRAVGLAGANEVVEAQIVALRDEDGPAGYAHFWGTVECGVDDHGGCRLVVSRLRPEGPGGPFFDPDPAEGWTGTIAGTPAGAQFDDYFILSGRFPMRYGIDSADANIAARLEGLRDTGSIVRVWGQVMCPAVDVQGTRIQVERIEVTMGAPAAPEGYEGWKPYLNARFGYAVRYPGECLVMGANPDDGVQFAGREWPVLTVSHYDSDFYHPPAGTDVYQWIADHDVPYDEIDTDVEIAGLPAVRLTDKGGPGWYAYDEYYFIKDGHLFRIMILHTGGQQDWDLYNKFLESFTFLQ